MNLDNERKISITKEENDNQITWKFENLRYRVQINYYKRWNEYSVTLRTHSGREVGWQKFKRKGNIIRFLKDFGFDINISDLENKVDKKMKLKEEFISNDFGFDCPKCHSKKYVQIEDGENGYGNPEYHFECKDCGYVSEVSEIDDEDLDEAISGIEGSNMWDSDYMINKDSYPTEYQVCYEQLSKVKRDIINCFKNCKTVKEVNKCYEQSIEKVEKLRDDLGERANKYCGIYDALNYLEDSIGDYEDKYIDKIVDNMSDEEKNQYYDKIDKEYEYFRKYGHFPSDDEDLDEVYQDDIILDEDIKETEYNVVIDNIEWSAENEDLPSSIQHDFFLSPYDNLEDEVYKFLLEYSNGVAPLGYSIDYNQADYYIKDDDYIGDEDNAYHTESFEDEEDLLNDRYDYVDSKMVYDSDGFMTEYTMYYDTLDNKYVFVFGDSDLYKPEDEDFDWECETRDEAEAWFNAYNGFEDDLDENLKEGYGSNFNYRIVSYKNEIEHWLKKAEKDIKVSLSGKYNVFIEPIQSKYIHVSPNNKNKLITSEENLDKIQKIVDKYINICVNSNYFKVLSIKKNIQNSTWNGGLIYTTNIDSKLAELASLDECNLKEAQGQNLYLKLRDEIKNSNNIKYLKNLDKKLVDEYLKSLNVDEKQALHHYIVLQIRKINDKSLNEDTIKQNGKWVNKGKEGTHGTFKTKKQADAQRKAMFANGYREDLNENKYIGKKAIFTGFDDYEDYEEARNYKGKTCIITCLDCEVDDDFDSNYWDIEFEDGFSMDAVSGYCLDLIEDESLKEEKTEVRRDFGVPVYAEKPVDNKFNIGEKVLYCEEGYTMYPSYMKATIKDVYDTKNGLRYNLRAENGYDYTFIPEDYIKKLNESLKESEDENKNNQFKKGDKIKVTQGHFKDLQGVVEKACKIKGQSLIHVIMTDKQNKTFEAFLEPNKIKKLNESLKEAEKIDLDVIIEGELKKLDESLLNEARNYESEYNITPADKKKIIQWWKDLDNYYKKTGSKSYVAGIDEIDKTDEIDGWLDTMWDALLDLVDEKKDSNEALELLRRGKALFNKYSKYSYFNYGVKESKQLNEKDYYADKTVGRYKIYPSKRTVKLKQRDGRNYGSIGSRPYVEFEDITLTWEDIDGMDINHSDIFEWFKAFKDGRVDKVLDNKLNNSQIKENKESKEKLESGDCAYHRDRDEYFYLKEYKTNSNGNKCFELYTYNYGKFNLAHPRFIDENSPFYNQLVLTTKRAVPQWVSKTESLKEESSLPRGKMITNEKGISYYQRGNKYYSNTGWLEKEINKDDFDKALNDYNKLDAIERMVADDFADGNVRYSFEKFKKRFDRYSYEEATEDDYNYYLRKVNELNDAQWPEEEDNIDESLNEDYFDDKEFITLSEEDQKQFEQLMNDNGWVLDDETARYGSKNFYDAWFHKEGDGAQDIHYQFITKDKYNEEQFDELIDNIFELLDECEKEYNTRIRFSAGLINDGSKYNGRGTIGIDIDAPELIVKGEDKVPAELAGHKIKLRGGKLIDDASKKVIKDIADHGFDVSQMGVKKDESLKETKITEGCWSCPNTVQKAKELVNLLNKPLLASEASDKLYNLLGDDELFDNIIDYENKEGSDYDVRFLVKDWIFDNILNNKNDIKWYTKFDSKAIDILKNALKKDSNYKNELTENLDEYYANDNDEDEQQIQRIVGDIWSKGYSNISRSNIYELVNLLWDNISGSGYNSKAYDFAKNIQDIAEDMIVDNLMDDWLDTLDDKYLPQDWQKLFESVDKIS